MNTFYLNCWVPSLKNYFKLQELKMYQLEILSKYILNEDDISLNETFDNIIKENFVEKNLLNKLTKYDKWFILLFLRASSLSSMLFYKAKDAQDNACAISFNLFDVLTDLSEINIPEIPSLSLDDLTIDFIPSKNLFSENYLLENIFKISINNKKYYPQAFTKEKKERLFTTLSRTVLDEIKIHFTEYRKNFDSIFILKNEKDLKDFYPIKFSLLDNLMYDFLKSTFAPYAHEFYKKKYILLSKLGIDLASINMLTPSECDVYINQFNTEKDISPVKN